MELKSSERRRPSGENMGWWKFRRSDVARRLEPARSRKTSEYGSSGMYATFPLGATANCATAVPVTATFVATVTALPTTRLPLRSRGTACRLPPGVTATR
jgi:hypothetical protein